MIKNKSILLTGGAGFIGSKIANALIDQGKEVIILDNLSNADACYIPTNASFVQGDIRNYDLVNYLMKQCQFCYHLAAVSSVPSSECFHYESYTVNVEGSYNVFDCASKLAVPVIYASSAAVYGKRKKTIPFEEEHDLNPINLYGHTKYMMECAAKFYGKTYGLKSLGLRFFNVYGYPFGQSPYLSVLRNFIQQIKNNKALTVYGDGRQVRDFIAIEDVVKVCLESRIFALTHAPIVNVCTGIGTSVLQLIDMLERIHSCSLSLAFCPSPSNDVLFSVGATQKILRLFPSFDPSNIQNGLKALVQKIESNSI